MAIPLSEVPLLDAGGTLYLTKSTSIIQGVITLFIHQLPCYTADPAPDPVRRQGLWGGVGAGQTVSRMVSIQLIHSWCNCRHVHLVNRSPPITFLFFRKGP